MDDVRHQLLEARVLDAGHAFGALEVGGSGVAALLALPGVVDQELGDLAERAALLAVVDDDAEPARLRGARALLDAVHEVGPAGADVGAEHVRAVAFVVHAAGDGGGGIGELGDVAEEIDGGAADGRQEHLQVGPGDELGEHAGRLLEQRAAQVRLRGPEALGDAGQIPDGIDGDLDDGEAAVGLHDGAVAGQPPRRHRVLHLVQVETRARHGDAGPDVDAFGDLGLKGVGHHVPPRVERDDGAGACPLPERADRRRRDGCW